MNTQELIRRYLHEPPCREVERQLHEALLAQDELNREEAALLILLENEAEPTAFDKTLLSEAGESEYDALLAANAIVPTASPERREHRRRFHLFFPIGTATAAAAALLFAVQMAWSPESPLPSAKTVSSSVQIAKSELPRPKEDKQIVQPTQSFCPPPMPPRSATPSRMTDATLIVQSETTLATVDPLKESLILIDREWREERIAQDKAERELAVEYALEQFVADSLQHTASFKEI
ncbi:hypothetical protein EII14_04225 [Alloprevotella sp. OH1205_COT-284]|uniref:hypothetical protein n=1 Tax=Alloprevotella sp. OH1205_COT-284 TaxID=2491043 RepID=UPI000F5D955A|nr:hypothetical protein [Alloprevotella sp. OH1205_COT-284]RRD80045.1 hypothetical protein EII14_04225 [Alloprevotella sp. OH1205_COT-284]